MDRYPAEALAWLLEVFQCDEHARDVAAEIRRYLENQVYETARGAQIETAMDASWESVLPSPLRAHAVFLEVLAGGDPEDELVGKLADGLVRRQQQGRWRTTEENAFALVALGRYFAAVERESPRFVARTWLGEKFLGERVFEGRQAPAQMLNVPGSYLTTGAGNVASLTIAQEGMGRLFYWLRLEYALGHVDVPAVAAGFEVSRRYEGAHDPSDVEFLADGRASVKAGALVRVRLFLMTPRSRRHVALVDPYPAGFEAGRDLPRWSRRLKGGPGELTRLRFSASKHHDDRAEVFVTSLPQGFYVHEYLVRATTPGLFLTPAARVEAMYEPEVFGRGTFDRVEVVDR